MLSWLFPNMQFLNLSSVLCPLTWHLYFFVCSVFCSSFPSFFDSILESILHEARRAPITFLYATDSKFLSSTESSTLPIFATFFISSTISEETYHSIYKSGMKFTKTYWDLQRSWKLLDLLDFPIKKIIRSDRTSQYISSFNSLRKIVQARCPRLVKFGPGR